jgi:uncharacterized protein (TIGR02099 family)
MSNPTTLARRFRSHAAQGWRRVRHGYRVANRWSHHALGMLLSGLLVLYFVFCGLVLGLRYLVLPNIDHYKPQVEQIASRVLQRQVSVGTIHASWHGLNPQLLLNEVVVRNRRGETALRLPRVAAALSWTSLLVADLRLDTLLIDRPDLEIERDAEGKLYVAGVPIEAGKEDGRGLDWLLSQREIRVRNGWVRWRDAERGAPQLTLENVQFLLRNQWRHHRFALKATPPTELGAPLDIRADFRHPSFASRISEFSRWSGTLYADWRDSDLEKWKAYFDYPFEVRSGKGGLRAWLAFDNARIADITADLGLSQLWLRLRPDLEPLDIRRISGRIAARIAPDAESAAETAAAQSAQSVALTDLAMETEDGLTLPSTTISASRIPAANGQAQRTEIRATLLDLEAISSFVGKLPLKAELHQALAQLAPRGVLRDFAAGWQGDYPQLAGWHLKGSFSALSLRPRPAQGEQPASPGFDDLAGSVDAGERGGSVSLNAPGAVLRLPGFLMDPELPFEQLQLQAKWTRPGAGGLQLQLDRLAFVQDGVAGDMHGSYQGTLSASGKPSAGVVNLAANVPEFDLRRIGRFLPMALPQGTREWLVGALQAGRASDVQMVLKGDLAQFPFHGAHAAGKPRGQFTVSGKLDGGRMNYTPGHFAGDSAAPMWPLLDQIHGSFLFDGARMEIRGDSAKTSGVALSRVEAVIADLASHDPLLEIRGQGLGPLQDYLRFINDSPVAEWIGNFTDQTRASGDARLALRLALPLGHVRDAKVEGSLQFVGNDIDLLTDVPTLSRVQGELKFGERGFALDGVRAGFLGGITQITGGTGKDGATAVRAEGAFSAEGLRAAYPEPAQKRLLARIAGGSRYSLQINVKGRQPEILVESSLQGTALDLPAPLSKAAADALPLRFVQSIVPAAAGEMRDELLLTLGKTLEARYARRRSDDAHAAWQLVRGGIGVNTPAPLPDSGLAANLNLERLDVDAWRALAEGGGTSAAAAPQGRAAAGGLLQYLDAQLLSARASELIIMGKKLDHVVLGATRAGAGWQANLQSTQASGHLSWSDTGRGPGRVSAHLATLTVPEAATSDVSELLQGKDASTQLPALDIVAEQFELSGKELGRLELVAENAELRAGREWRINRLVLANPDASFAATGKWAISNGANRSSLDYQLDIGDAGKLLERFGYAHVLKGGKGKMGGQLSWDGLPFKIDMPSLSGQMQLDIAAGQFLKVDPGVAKLLGVLSLQSLPRRLTLDFRDVFSEGFAFDGVVASAGINHGVMKTDSFKMRGLSAVVLLDGEVDIAHETQDLTVVVLPEINAGAASVAYGLMVNPVIGLGTFLAQLFLRDPLMHAFTMEYHIAGSWKDPAISKLNRNAGKSGPIAANPPGPEEKPR